jgi:hypothetical protein
MANICAFEVAMRGFFIEIPFEAGVVKSETAMHLF